MVEHTDRLSTALADRYRIVEHLGEGGMANVYLAEDLKHQRKVAVKVLRPELAAVLGADRFVQEIRTTASLQHPHILPLFDSGEADGFLFYVMPFIDGETLRDKLNRETQLGVDDAVKITTQIADALNYAHGEHIIHRDIKPENILLRDGHPIVADFGIALAVSAAAGGRMTETGLTLGTPHYMSPEQATAEKEITHRSDIYSLGSVLYEMLTGEPPHTGGSAQQIIMKIVSDDARPVTELRKAVPPNVAAAVAKSVEKVPADRFSTATEFAAALEDERYMTPYTTSPPHTEQARLGGRWGPYAVIGALAVATVAGWTRNLEVDGPVTRVSVRFPAEQPRAGNGHFDLSSDGTLLVYEGPGNDGGTQLWARRWDELQAMPIRGTDDLTDFALSPDGAEIAAVTPSDSAIRLVPIGGGTGRTIARGRAFEDVAWGPEGEWLYFTTFAFALARVNRDGGDVEAFTTLDSAATRHFNVSVSPDGRLALFTASDFFKLRPELWVLDLASKQTTKLATGANPRLVGDYLFFVEPDIRTLFAARFDPREIRLATPHPVAEGLTAVPGDGNRGFAVAETGTLVYSTGSIDEERQPVRVMRDGTERPFDTAWRGDIWFPRLSHDDTRVAYSSLRTVYVKRLDEGPITQLSFDGTVNYRPTWTPDGQVAYASDRMARELEMQFFIARPDGTGEVEATGVNAPAGMLSADGEWWIYRTANVGGTNQSDLMAMRTAPGSEPVSLVATPALEAQAVLSPDGAWLAYTSDRSGSPEVYVRPFPNVDSARITISNGGGTSPAWANTRPELYYRATDGNLIAVQFTESPAWEETGRQVLFDAGPYVRTPRGGVPRLYDVSSDDEWFVMLRQAGTDGNDPRELILVQNYLAELRQRDGN